LGPERKETNTQVRELFLNIKWYLIPHYSWSWLPNSINQKNKHCTEIHWNANHPVEFVVGSVGDDTTVKVSYLASSHL